MAVDNGRGKIRAVPGDRVGATPMEGYTSGIARTIGHVGAEVPNSPFFVFVAVMGAAVRPGQRPRQRHHRLLAAFLAGLAQ